MRRCRRAAGTIAMMLYLAIAAVSGSGCEEAPQQESGQVDQVDQASPAPTPTVEETQPEQETEQIVAAEQAPTEPTAQSEAPRQDQEQEPQEAAPDPQPPADQEDEPAPQQEQEADPQAVEEEQEQVDADAALLAQLRVAPESNDGIAYDRDLYMPTGWIDADGDGCSTWAEVLIAEASRIRGVDATCYPIGGEWLSWYDGLLIERPSDLDVDHMVPLAEAHRSGAAPWPTERKRRFANDLDDPATLTAVSELSNRAKSAYDPSEWMPPLQSAWCQYARDWIAVKLRWDLSADAAEAEALGQMLDTCVGSAVLRPIERLDRELPILAGASRNGGSSVYTGPVYASCDAAEAAGEMRQRGSRGSASGFPAGMVPTARDGDGDGVVCER